ncbi:Hypp3 [Branchiostoma lanceolatum]|uniref:Hypp3 protein n=1 Tax=Branchiostoma lanceolatum TaxID=7740 RepID=A0A8J9V961_BRALA|nr:Hypp3 [Branchiostoma lanceolatum]
MNSTVMLGHLVKTMAEERRPKTTGAHLTSPAGTERTQARQGSPAVRRFLASLSRSASSASYERQRN